MNSMISGDMPKQIVRKTLALDKYLMRIKLNSSAVSASMLEDKSDEAPPHD